MTSTKSHAEILKQDERGRVRVGKERREALVEEFERSGLSAAKFARLSGVKYSTFASWVARRRNAQATATSPSGESEGAEEAKERPRPIRLFEAVSENNVALGGGLIVELPGGSRVVVGSPGQLQLAGELVVMIAQGRGVRC
jgi:transposase-like protein